jgi:spore maturation protein SpmB
VAGKTYFEMFVDGAREGWRVGTHAILPNMVMAFTIIKVLEDTGAMKVLGHFCSPVMMLFGVPGAAATALIAALLSIAGGVGVVASLLASGTLTGADATILLAGIFLLGGQIQNLGRVFGVVGLRPRFFPLLWGVTLANAVIGMLIMRVLVKGI